MKISWTGVTGRNYRIASRDNLSSGGWTESGNVTAAGANASWTDTTAASASQRFYVVYVTN
jgi:hypothetical protein